MRIPGRTTSWIAVSTLMALAAAAAGFGAVSGPTTREPVPASANSSTSTSSPVAPSATIPANLSRLTYIQDLTWVSETHGWALVGHDECIHRCSEKVLTTTDGANSWSRVGTIPWVPSCAGACASSIRFANSTYGYAYGPDLFMSADGGRSWTLQPGPAVVGLEIAGSDVIRASATGFGCPGPCNLAVEEAPIGSSSWTTLYSVPRQGSSRVQLVRQGPDDIYLADFQNPAGGAQDEQTTLFISHDGGATWTARLDPCGYSGTVENDSIAIAAAPGQVVAALCIVRTGLEPDFVALSTDGGVSFARSNALPENVAFQVLGATSATSIFVGTAPGYGAPTLEATGDGGLEWTQVARDASTSPAKYVASRGFLGFETTSVGRWLGGPNDIYTTVDGGLTWTRRSI